MGTMNISLPDETKAWIEAETAQGSYGSASDYFRELVRRDRERKAAIAWLRKEVDIGLQSGISSRTIDEIFAEARRVAAAEGLLRD